MILPRTSQCTRKRKRVENTQRSFANAFPMYGCKTYNIGKQFGNMPEHDVDFGSKVCLGPLRCNDEWPEVDKEKGLCWQCGNFIPDLVLMMEAENNCANEGYSGDMENELMERFKAKRKEMGRHCMWNWELSSVSGRQLSVLKGELPEKKKEEWGETSVLFFETCAPLEWLIERVENGQNTLPMLNRNLNIARAVLRCLTNGAMSFTLPIENCLLENEQKTHKRINDFIHDKKGHARRRWGRIRTLHLKESISLYWYKTIHLPDHERQKREYESLSARFDETLPH
jgi:hypothetical protein